jgi:hypothetical protein
MVREVGIVSRSRVETGSGEPTLACGQDEGPASFSGSFGAGDGARRGSEA